jgi:hypothetical protein
VCKKPEEDEQRYGTSLYTPELDSQAEGSTTHFGSTAEGEEREGRNESDNKSKINGSLTPATWREGYQAGTAVTMQKNSLSMLYCNAQSTLNKIDELNMLIAISPETLPVDKVEQKSGETTSGIWYSRLVTTLSERQGLIGEGSA